MSTVVQFNVPSQQQSQGARHSALLHSFAAHRRFGDDVFWLKENAELLNILECTGVALEDDALGAHESFYDNIEKRMGFFPQYYRFLLSICLDLEDLGMDGGKGEKMVNWVADQGMAQSEMSDLQRFEARRLMLRRGRDPLPGDLGLEDRMRGFCERSVAFAMPNKKAAYELTHTVFYLSEYGRKDPLLGADAKQSLENAGTLAFLDQNADLLAEVCVAMRYAGFPPAKIWENWVQRETHRFDVEIGDASAGHDDYHEYFVSNWLMALAGNDVFAKRFAPESMRFYAPQGRIAPLREMSECMFRLDDQRSDDWARMRGHVVETMSPEAMDVLNDAEAASNNFDAFFSGFARVGMAAGAV
ncbi:MAG: hypothetical protein Q9M48_05130 [Rhodobacterales bacterium]|nr:hypothetical protein [Rhodobacterales bacterium]